MPPYENTFRPSSRYLCSVSTHKRKKYSCYSRVMIKFERNVPLAQFTSWKVGGEAEYFFKANTADELRSAVSAAIHKGMPFRILGGGNNILVSDDGVDGLVILNRTKGIEVRGDNVFASSGEMLAMAIMTGAKEGLGGLEGMVGIPGSIGGAVYGNAGSFGLETKDVLVETTVLDSETVKTYTIEDLQYEYRESFLKQNPNLIVLDATIKLQKKDPALIQKDIIEIQKKRHEQQPLGVKTCGSVFKRPPGDYAGRLIEAAGLKGVRVGGVVVSDKHANFFTNEHNATARDIKNLLEKVRAGVMNKFGVRLEEEVQYLGR